MEVATPPGVGVADGGLKVAVIPVGTLMAFKVTAELNVPIDCTPMLTVALFP